MKKKIVVIVRQFKSSIGNLDVDSRLYDGDTKEPIFLKEQDPQGNPYDYHIGQISSSLLWAVQDIPDQGRTAKIEMDRRYPKGYEFVFYYIPVDFIKQESAAWWDNMTDEQKKELVIEEGQRVYGKLTKLEKDTIRSRKLRHVTQNEVENLWKTNEMVNFAMSKLKPVDLNNVIF